MQFWEEILEHTLATAVNLHEVIDLPLNSSPFLSHQLSGAAGPADHQQEDQSNPIIHFIVFNLPTDAH
jgi:hypothetical protein